MEEIKTNYTPKRLSAQIGSEIGFLEEVIIHRPGNEIENMTPENAQRALYSDILNLQVVQKEYSHFEKVLKKTCSKVYLLKELLIEVLYQDENKLSLVSQVCQLEQIEKYSDKLLEKSSSELAVTLIEGLPIEPDSLSNYLSKNRYALLPLHNALFVRDAAMTVWDSVVISRMANKIRQRETYIMDAIFNYHFNNKVINPEKNLGLEKLTSIEGGDVMVISDRLLLIGIGRRTSAQGVDFIINQLKSFARQQCTIIVQELPETPESFIHLDMVFTQLDKDVCMAYTPLLLRNNKYQTIRISIDNGKVRQISNEEDIFSALRKENYNMDIIACGGTDNLRTQEREQWHSGANFLAVAPGKIIGYSRNNNTLEALNKSGFEIVTATDIITGQKKIDQFNKCAISLDGAELARGGGGARCMSLPIKRSIIS